MKVLLLKDVYKLGRAGDVRRVADGYGRNFLLPQGLAVLATAGALKQAEHIRSRAATNRAQLNQELGGVAEKLGKLTLTFPTRAGETGKLYGSITAQMIADQVKSKLGIELNRRQIDAEPLRTLGTHKVHVRLTMDLVPVLNVIVHRDSESPAIAKAMEEQSPVEAPAEDEAAGEAA